MRLAHKDLSFVIKLTENSIPVLVFEKPEVFRKYVMDLIIQCEGRDGDFVLSRNWEPVSIVQNAVMITDPFHIDPNNKKFLNILWKKLQQIAISHEYYQVTATVRQALTSWILDLENEITLPITHDDEIPVPDLIKACGVRFDIEETSIPETLERYIELCARFLNIPILIIVGLHNVVSQQELELLYRKAEYEKLILIILERNMPDQKHPREAYYIVDKDLCEIYNDEG